MRHPRYTDLRVKSLRGLSGLTCMLNPVKKQANFIFPILLLLLYLLGKFVRFKVSLTLEKFNPGLLQSFG